VKSDALAVQLDGLWCLGGGAQMAPEGRQKVVEGSARGRVLRGVSAVLAARRRRYHSLSLVERLARLGWTRIGSPGIFGVHTRETPS
jgi:hypothetical protein